MQQEAKLLQDYMRQNGLSQAQLAKEVGVSQSAVSRAISGTLHRRGAARRKLFAYAGIDDYKCIKYEGDPRAKVMAAFDRIWDNSKAHADAIARVIQALDGLEPKRMTQQEEERRK